MEEDIIKHFDFEINNIIDHCLNVREITATEYMFIKQRLLLKIEDLVKKNEKLMYKNKEQEKIIDLMAKSLEELKIACLIKDGGEYRTMNKEELKDYFKKKAREKNEI